MKVSFFQKIFCSLLLIISSFVLAHNADLVIFSFDRPMQLYALLESVQTYVRGLEHINVVYRVSNDAFEQGYAMVHADFPSVNFFKQGAQPRNDFKPLTLQAVFDAPSDYIIFAVDDMIVTNYVDLSDCIEQLEKTNAYFFSLRLGKNITRCYMAGGAIQNLPHPFEQIADNVYQWRINTGSHDWGYPHTVDMTLYRKVDIAFDFKNISYHSPNSFEGRWASQRGRVAHRTALCHKHSSVINIPMNLVQSDCPRNRNMDAYSTQDLLDIFDQGKKIDIASFYQFENDSPWIELTYTFIER